MFDRNLKRQFNYNSNDNKFATRWEKFHYLVRENIIRLDFFFISVNTYLAIVDYFKHLNAAQ